MTKRPLLDKPCRPVSRKEDRRIRMERMSEPPVFLASLLELTVDESIAIDMTDAELGEKPEVGGDRAAYLCLCKFRGSDTLLGRLGTVGEVECKVRYDVPDDQ